MISILVLAFLSAIIFHIDARPTAPTSTRLDVLENIELSADGEVSSYTSSERAVNIKNHLDEAITVYWAGDDNNVVKMGIIDASSEMKLNTFVGHSFFPARLDNPDEKIGSDFVSS